MKFPQGGSSSEQNVLLTIIGLGGVLEEKGNSALEMLSSYLESFIDLAVGFCKDGPKNVHTMFYDLKRYLTKYRSDRECHGSSLRMSERA